MNDLRAYLLDPNAHRSSHYTSWSSALEVPAEVVESYDTNWEAPDDAGVVVSVCHYNVPEVSILRRLTEQCRVPVLILADGILEYRNTFEHPDLAPGAIFQPVLGHKLACIGRSQVRMVESWGNLGKCELVGAPRLDALRNRQARQRVSDEPFRVLVATACTPAFTPRQAERLRESLVAVRDWFDSHASVAGVPLQPVWRLTRHWAHELSVENVLPQFDSLELAVVLEQIDAVITTPSTVMLEGMLQGVPVALLDYNNCPHYVPAAWEITAPQHVDQVVPELIQPPEAKLLYQNTILHDALECRTPATPRMVRLVEEMIRVGHECRSKGKPLEFPRRMLADEQAGHHLPEECFDMQRLYPEHPVFANMDRVALQVEVGQLQVEVNRLRHELQWLRQQAAEPAQERLAQGPLWRNIRNMWYGKKSA